MFGSSHWNMTYRSSSPPLCRYCEPGLSIACYISLEWFSWYTALCLRNKKSVYLSTPVFCLMHSVITSETLLYWTACFNKPLAIFITEQLRQLINFARKYAKNLLITRCSCISHFIMLWILLGLKFGAAESRQTARHAEYRWPWVLSILIHHFSLCATKID